MAHAKIGIIGAGNMGRAFATRFAAAGHDVTITATNAAHAAEAAAAAGHAARAVPAADVGAADIVILAVPYGAAAAALGESGGLAGKIVVDITNPLTADMAALSVGFTSSAGEEIQKLAPHAKVVKGFNTVFAQLLGSASRAQVFLAGDDADAKATVAGVAESAGFDTVDAGPLANARLLEPLGLLNIYLGYVAGRGTAISPAVVAAS
jgi:8-hydroxy-5-deazaflavin:NADPH oxidoreductase